MYSSKGILPNKTVSKNTSLEGTNSPRLPVSSAGLSTHLMSTVLLCIVGISLPPRKGAPTNAGAGLILSGLALWGGFHYEPSTLKYDPPSGEILKPIFSHSLAAFPHREDGQLLGSVQILTLE